MHVARDPFVALPNEVFEVVLTFLELKSIKRLRLTSTQYAKKCLCPAFTRYYSHQETDLSAFSLQRLLELTTHPVLGPAVNDLAVVAAYYDPSIHVSKIRRLTSIPSSSVPQAHHATQLLDSTMELSWVMSRRQEQQAQFVDDLVASFAQIFENLASLGSLRLRTRIVCFRSMRLAFRPPASMNWNALWADCHRLLRIVVLAMARSKISVTTLSIFDQTFGKVQSRAFTEMSTDLGDLKRGGFMATTGDRIKNLNLSFSTRTIVPERDVVETVDGLPTHLGARRTLWERFERRAPEDVPGIAAFLKQTPNLEGLDLYMYNTLAGAPYAYDQVFVTISREVRLPNLRRLTLRGIWTKPDALLLFLRNHPDITHLDLREVHISTASWYPVFEHIQTMQKLSKLHLENLFAGSRRLLNLKPTDPVFDDGKRGEGHSYSTRSGTMVHSRDISMEELRQAGGLSFVDIPGSHRGKGSKALMSWVYDRRRDYGPPR